jgi:hypothetical protein
MLMLRVHYTYSSLNKGAGEKINEDVLYSIAIEQLSIFIIFSILKTSSTRMGAEGYELRTAGLENQLKWQSANLPVTKTLHISDLT